MKSENPQAYLVTVPYNDLRAMEDRCEFLEKIRVQLKSYIHLPLNDDTRKLIGELNEAFDKMSKEYG